MCASSRRFPRVRPSAFLLHCTVGCLTESASRRTVGHLEVTGLPSAARNKGGCHDFQKHFGRKGSNVTTINPTADVCAAAKLMAERGIGAVVVLGADHRIVGILSERDIVQALAGHGQAVLSEPLSQVMTREVKTCSEDDHIGDLMARMTVEDSAICSRESSSASCRLAMWLRAALKR